MEKNNLTEIWQGLESLLNKSPCSIKLYDSYLIKFEFINGKFNAYFELSKFGIVINELEKYVDSLENSLVIKLTFSGIEKLSFSSLSSYDFEFCEILTTSLRKNRYQIVLKDKFLSHAKISLNFSGFKWSVLGELAPKEIDKLFY